MNEEKLTELLKNRQQAALPDFTVSPEGFQQKLTVEINHFKARTRRIYKTLGAIFVITAGILLYQLHVPTPKAQTENPAQALLAPLAEIQKLFNTDVALLMINDELVTGERLATGKVHNNIALKVTDSATGKVFTLAFAGADNDSLQLDSPEWTGDIILSRSDESTLVIDLTLRCKDCTRPIQTIVTIDDKADNSQIDTFYKEVRLT